MNIVLIGMMGCGKSTIGEKLAKKISWKFKDTDSLIEQHERQSIPKIFELKGENYFRECEKKVIHDISVNDQSVIATGGGAPCFAENWKSLTENGVIIYLKCSPQTLISRISKKSLKSRPMLKKKLTLDSISKLLESREPYYKHADYTISTDIKTVNQVVEEIIQLFLDKIKR